MRGADWFKSIGMPNSSGNTLFGVSGQVKTPGIFEMPLGVKMRDLIYKYGGSDVRFNNLGSMHCLYWESIQRSKESVLKNNLFTLRTVIDEYTYDKQKAPQSLQDLVSDGYLRQVPIDPITGNADSWRLIMEDASNTVNQTMPGIFDVRSGADGTSLEGTPYSEW